MEYCTVIIKSSDSYNESDKHFNCIQKDNNNIKYMVKIKCLVVHAKLIKNV